MGLWDKISKDIRKGIDEGIAAVKQGANIAVVKAEELAEEGKRKYKIFELKQKIHSSFTELGGRVYDLSSQSSKDTLRDTKVRSIISDIKKTEAQISKLEHIVLKTPTKKGSAKSRK